MNSWSFVSLKNIAATPWLNGGGLTRELLAWPHPLDWTVRFSVAEVERDGPFSKLAGVHRWFAVLSGAGVRLRIDDAVHELTVQSQPLEFDGAARADCELLAGPSRDFNLMLRQGHATMKRVSGAIDAKAGAQTLAAVYALEPGAVLSAGGETLQLPARTLAWRMLETETPLGLTGEALWIEITP
jgi:uncharacterized protein